MSCTLVTCIKWYIWAIGSTYVTGIVGAMLEEHLMVSKSSTLHQKGIQVNKSVNTWRVEFGFYGSREYKLSATVTQRTL
jgi:hypothetical protein